MHQIPAVIPVRRGSTGLPGKNMHPVDGRPLLSYTIAAAKRSNRLSSVIVSTDDEAIAKFAQDEGAQALLHPQHLSTDGSPTISVVVWNFQRLMSTKLAPDAMAVLRATSPLRTSADIDAAVGLLFSRSDVDSVVSVTPAVGYHPIRLKRIDEGWLVDAFDGEGHSPRRRQTLETLYIRNGAIYVAKREVLGKGYLWGDHCLPYLMPQERSLNINTRFDLLVAELLIKYSGCPSGTAGLFY